MSTHVMVANLDPVEKGLLDTLIAVLTDPALWEVRLKLRNGELALIVEGDDVSWVNPLESESPL